MTGAALQSDKLDPAKFRDLDVTADGQRRASVALESLETLWINTGTLCNLTCDHCYIDSSPTNDRLAYITAAEVGAYLDEIAALGLETREIGFTGGEPFMNPHIIPMLADALGRGFETLVLTNGMRPMMKHEAELRALGERFGAGLAIRVSIDHYTPALHELERGSRSWEPTIAGLEWLSANGFETRVCGRTRWGEPEARLREGYGRLFARLGVRVNAQDPTALVLLPEMDERLDVPEITVSCWGLLGVDPADIMCAASRMVIKHRGEAHPTVVACTLLPYDPQFELGRRLEEAMGDVKLNHPHCARFCVLGGGSCSAPG